MDRTAPANRPLSVPTRARRYAAWDDEEDGPSATVVTIVIASLNALHDTEPPDAGGIGAAPWWRDAEDRFLCRKPVDDRRAKAGAG